MLENIAYWDSPEDSGLGVQEEIWNYRKALAKHWVNDKTGLCGSCDKYEEDWKNDRYATVTALELLRY